MVAVSFRGKFKHWWTYLACAVTAVTFGLIGLIGTFFDNLLYSFPQVLLQLDYMFLLEAGVVFGICALTYQHEKLPFKLSLPAPASLLHNIAFPVPKIPHSPTGLNRTSISGSH
jgi:hypothetical protein